MASSRCRFCNQDNPDGARFCNACGSPLHLKPCPQCEAVNDTAAAQCYECGAALATNAPAESITAIPTPAAADNSRADTEGRRAAEDSEGSHVPDTFGARFESLPPMEEHANVAAAERRDAYARSNRTSRAFFFAVVLLILGAFGYYGYQHRFTGESDGGAATATAQGENREPLAEAQRTAAAPASEVLPPKTQSGDSASTQSAAPSKPVDAPQPQPVAAQTAPAGPDVVSAASSSDSKPPPTNIKAMAQPRQPAPRPASRVDTPYSRPAPASDASAVATQQMIERYLGIRAGAAPQRSVQ
jgi:hypothetical protein